MKSDTIPDADSFVLPVQTLRGSRQEMLAAIDQAIVGLLALRHLVAGESLVVPGLHETPAANPSRRGVATAIAHAGRVFSNLVRKHD